MKIVSSEVTDRGPHEDEACWVLKLHHAMNCEEDKERAREFLHGAIHMSLEQTEEIVRQTIEFMRDGKVDEQLFVDLVGALTHPTEEGSEEWDEHLAASLYAAVIMSLARQRLEE